jgi:hypothetical protein
MFHFLNASIMKKTLSFLSFLLIVCSTSGYGQSLSKKTLLSGLNDSGVASMSAKQKKNHDAINNTLLLDLVKMDSKKQSKSNRDKDIDRLFDKRDRDIDKLFATDPSYVKKYKKEYQKKSRSLRMKIKLAQLVL